MNTSDYDRPKVEGEVGHRTETGYVVYRRGLTDEQYEYLLNPLRSTRVATRSVSGRNLSYLEAWDVKAHLNRIFGFTGWDSELLDYGMVGNQAYAGKDDKPMVEVAWHGRVRLIVKDQYGNEIARYTEAAVGSAAGGSEGAGIGDLHDNALKSAESDALKRCAINLGTQFGLSLYDNGNRNDVVKKTLIAPEGWQPKEPDPDQSKNLEKGVGVSASGEPTNEGVDEGASA